MGRLREGVFSLVIQCSQLSKNMDDSQHQPLKRPHFAREGRTVNERNLRAILEQAWSRETSADPDHWSAQNPAWGQCAVTALIVQDLYGGSLLRTKVGPISHYWNLLPSGGEIDLTRGQFGSEDLTLSGEPRSREYVVSFPDTVQRYETLKARVDAIFASRRRETGALASGGADGRRRGRRT